MTSPEHTLVGIHFAFACGLHRRLGWQGVAMAGVASNFPDWDGIPMLIDMQRFEAGHRAWGHSVLSILLASVVLATTQFAFDWIGAIGKWVVARFPTMISQPLDTNTTLQGGTVAWALFGVAVLVQLLHLPCDMVVSGGSGLTDWPIQPWWPFSNTGYVFPLIPWGDVGPTVILMTGMVVIAARKSHMSTKSAITLILLVVYLFVRGWSRGSIGL